MSRPLTITFAISGWARKPGGGTRVIYGYASRLAARGHRVRVVHAAFLRPSQYRFVRPRREWKNLVRGMLDVLRGRPAHVGWESVDDRVGLSWVWFLGRRTIPPSDVVVATAWRTAVPVARLPSDRGGRAYFIQHYESWDASVRAVDDTWRLPLHRIVIAGWLFDVARRLDVSDTTTLIPNAIDGSRFRVTRDPETREPRVAMLWSSAPIKGGDVGLRVLEGAQARVPQLRATLFGVGAPPRGLPAWVEFRQGPTGDELVDDVYNRAAVYLCPSRGEGWHLPPAEAMACGCAVVSTAIDGVADYAHDGVTAMLAPVDDVEALTKALKRVLIDPDLRSSLVNNGRREIIRFSWDRATDKFERVMYDLAGRL